MLFRFELKVFPNKNFLLMNWNAFQLKIVWRIRKKGNSPVCVQSRAQVCMACAIIISPDFCDSLSLSMFPYILLSYSKRSPYFAVGVTLTQESSVTIPKGPASQFKYIIHLSIVDKFFLQKGFHIWNTLFFYSTLDINITNK